MILSQILIHCCVLSAVPGRPSIDENVTNTTSVSITWSIPTGSVVSKYTVEWSSGSWCPDGDAENSFTLLDGPMSYTISNLTPGTWCNVSVTATNSAGSTSSERLDLKLGELGKE